MDSLFLYIEINSIFILLLLILLIYMGRSFTKSTDEKYFCNALLLNIMVLIADTGTWIFDGRVFLGTLWLNKLVFFAYYFMTALFVFAWALYSAYKLQVNWKVIKKNLVLISIPMIIAQILSIVSLWNGCLFEFDSNGVYQRGELFAVHTAILWVYLVLSLISVINILFSEKREELFNECLAMMVSVTIPVIGGILQTLFYGLNMAWTGSCISFVIIFISVQNKHIVMDGLTKVHNRGSFEKNLREAIEKKSSSKDLYLIMIDINKFKSINDTYGHIAGDKALVEISKNLSSITNAIRNDLLARYGGDEFVILCKRKEQSEVEIMVDTIKKKCADIYKQGKLEFEVSISVGWSRFDPQVHKTAEQFIDSADEMMYEQKRSI